MSEKHIRLHRPLMDYIEYFETLNRRSLPLIEKLAESDLHFKDPLNDVRGLDSFQAVFMHMFDRVDNPKFKVIDFGWAQRIKAKNVAYLMWDFTAVSRGKSMAIQGMSEVTFSLDGKVMAHIDYWDAGTHLYERIPVLGSVIRWVKSKITA
jgi:steroid delta-isomerase